MRTARYLFRGTTVGWPGNPVLRDLSITPTTTDPLIATLFAILGRNHAEAVIQIVTRGTFDEESPNFLDDLECAVNLSVRPSEFADRTVQVSLEVSLRVLGELGFLGLPMRLNDPSALQDALREIDQRGQRLNPDQILDYVSRVTRVSQ